MAMKFFHVPWRRGDRPVAPTTHFLVDGMHVAEMKFYGWTLDF